MSGPGRYCCKSRKSNDAENLAKADVYLRSETAAVRSSNQALVGWRYRLWYRSDHHHLNIGLQVEDPALHFFVNSHLRWRSENMMAHCGRDGGSKELHVVVICSTRKTRVELVRDPSRAYVER